MIGALLNEQCISTIVLEQVRNFIIIEQKMLAHFVFHRERLREMHLICQECGYLCPGRPGPSSSERQLPVPGGLRRRHDVAAEAR